MCNPSCLYFYFVPPHPKRLGKMMNFPVVTAASFEKKQKNATFDRMIPLPWHRNKGTLGGKVAGMGGEGTWVNSGCADFPSGLNLIRFLYKLR